MKGYIYVCHTYYHVYISILKELARPKEEQGNASVVLSTMSTDFENLSERLKEAGFFKEVLVFEEKAHTEFPELEKYHHPSKTFVMGLINRIIYTKKYAKLQKPNIPTNFKEYEQIYVFCDSDPIGYYLNYMHIPYHAVEDGLNTIRSSDLARADNTPHFNIKAFFSKKLNWIFIQNGYGKYCIDMEVNDISVLKYPCPYYVEVSREGLTKRLTADEKEMLIRIFVCDADKLRAALQTRDCKTAVVLTEPLCTLDVRKQIFQDMIVTYSNEYLVILKQHPRDYMDYEKEFPDTILIDRTVPMEILNFFGDCKFDLVVSVFTELDNVYFASQRLRLGRDFMDKYEDREIHESRFESK